MAGQHAGRAERQHAAGYADRREGFALAAYRAAELGAHIAVRGHEMPATDPEAIGAVGPVSGDAMTRIRAQLR